ncbi:hypothetical protein Scep_007352 [Stephania cephalantha]|uniref:Aminotransferase-like plant mobile domain-containing protein n=1 Tax=Stephania cephalantha TaxID=152367 RepID=A0AAP0KAZ5_9MAGN
MLMDVPLGHRWLDAFSFTQSATHVVSAYRDAFDSQRNENDVVWQPYAEVMGSLLDYCTNGHGSWLSTCPLICFHIVEWHRLERVMRQFEMVQVVPPNCAYDTQLHRIELRGRHQENWVTFHARYIQMWENCGDNIATTTHNEGHDHQDYMTWYHSITRRFIGHDGALRDYSCNLVHNLRRVFIEDEYEQGLVALDEMIKILDEDEMQRSTLWHDGIDVEHDINEDNEQEDEEDDQGETNREVRRRRTRPETVRERTKRPPPPRPFTQTEIAAESSIRSPPAHSSRPRASRTEIVADSSQRSSLPSHSSHGCIPALSTMQPEPHMFVPRPQIVNLPPYHFDPYAPGPSSSYVDHGMLRHQMYLSLPHYMPSPYTPPCYNYNMSYSGDDSFMNLLTMPQPHVHFPQPHTGSQYFGMVQPPIFGSIRSRGESSEAPEEEHQSTRCHSM